MGRVDNEGDFICSNCGNPYQGGECTAFGFTPEQAALYEKTMASGGVQK